MIFTSFASGSTGNCTFISTNTENVLVDCGISAKRITENLLKLGKKPDDINGILLTHEHIDHVKGLKRLIQLFHIPVYCSIGTWNHLSEVTKDQFFDYAGCESFHPVCPDRDFYIGNLLVHPFHTYHDTSGPLGYRFETEEEICGKDVNLAVVTDCGIYDDYICENLRDLDALLIESNHDVDMLMSGPYPMYLKRRILSQRGHSSNAGCAQTLNRIWTPRLEHVLLAHLSDENNTPEKALCCMRELFEHPETTVSVAPKNEISEIIHL